MWYNGGVVGAVRSPQPGRGSPGLPATRERRTFHVTHRDPYRPASSGNRTIDARANHGTADAPECPGCLVCRPAPQRSDDPADVAAYLDSIEAAEADPQQAD